MLCDAAKKKKKGSIKRRVMISSIIYCLSSPVGVNVPFPTSVPLYVLSLCLECLPVVVACKSPISLSASRLDCHLFLETFSDTSSSVPPPDNPHGLISVVLITLYSNVFVCLLSLFNPEFLESRQYLTNSSINV